MNSEGRWGRRLAVVVAALPTVLAGTVLIWQLVPETLSVMRILLLAALAVFVERQVEHYLARDLSRIWRRASLIGIASCAAIAVLVAVGP